MMCIAAAAACTSPSGQREPTDLSTHKWRAHMLVLNKDSILLQSIGVLPITVDTMFRQGDTVFFGGQYYVIDLKQ